MDKITVLFPDFKTKAYTLSFDDGHDSDIPLIELMKKYHLKGSFNLNSGQLYPDGAEVPTIYEHVPLTEKKALELFSDDDFEVVSHGYNHCAVGHIPPADALYDMLTDRRKLEGMFGKLVRGHVYPYGSYSADAEACAKLCGFVYARRCESKYNFKLPEPGTWLSWNPTAHLLDNEYDELIERFITVPNDYYHGQLFYAWAHSFEFIRSNGWEVLERKFKRIADNPEIWYATNIEVYEYVEAFRGLIYSADSTFVYNPSQIDVYLRCDYGKFCIPAGETVKLVK